MAAMAEPGAAADGGGTQVSQGSSALPPPPRLSWVVRRQTKKDVNTMITGQWVVEYSHKQAVFHLDTLVQSLKGNIESFVMGVHTDYVLLGICDSQREAEELIGKLKAAKASQVKFVSH